MHSVNIENVNYKIKLGDISDYLIFNRQHGPLTPGRPALQPKARFLW